MSKQVFILVISFLISTWTLQGRDNPMILNSTCTLEARSMHEGEILITWKSKDLPRRADKFVLYRICNDEVIKVVEEFDINKREDGQTFMTVDKERSAWTSYQLVVVDRKGNVTQSNRIDLIPDSQDTSHIESTLASCN